MPEQAFGGIDQSSDNKPFLIFFNVMGNAAIVSFFTMSGIIHILPVTFFLFSLKKSAICRLFPKLNGKRLRWHRYNYHLQREIHLKAGFKRTIHDEVQPRLPLFSAPRHEFLTVNRQKLVSSPTKGRMPDGLSPDTPIILARREESPGNKGRSAS